MRRALTLRVIVLLPLVLAVGCLSENRGQIEGTRWTSLAGTIDVKMSRGPTSVSRSIRLPAGFMELDFQKDGSLFYVVRGKIHTGKYSLGVGNSITLHLDEEVAGLKMHTETVK